MTLISDILRGPYGDPQPNVIITMRAKETSARVLVSNSSAATTADDGKYSMQVFPGEYEVMVSTLGKVGEIRVYPDSKDGTLNDFLLAPEEDELTPVVVQTVDTMRADAAKSAAAAKISEGNSKKSETNAANSAAQVVTAFDNVRFKFPENNVNATTWFLLGRFKNAGQNGVGVAINFYGSNGFNGFTYNAGLSRLMLRTGNLTASDTTNKVNRIGGIYVDDARSMILDFQIIESSRDNYDIYVKVSPFTINCWYTVEQITYANAAGLRWEHKAEKQTVDPIGVMKVDMRTSVSYSQALALPAYDFVARPSQNGFGLGPQHRVDVFSEDNTSSVGRFNASSLNIPGASLGACITLPMDGGPSCGYLAVTSGRGLWIGGSNSTTNKAITWNRTWSEVNTTVDSNGFIKKASPIVKLFGNGTCELNDESQGVTTERVSDGVYRVSGTLGFNADAQWGGSDGGIEVPLDRNKQPLIWVDYEVEPTGDLLIKTYHRTHPTAPAFARNEVMGYDEGMPIDIPEGRWVDLRVEMPAGEDMGAATEVEPVELVGES